MKLCVQYMAQLRPLIGCSDEQVDLPEGTNVARLLTQLATAQPAAATHLLTATGQMRPSLLVARNGAAISVAEAATTVLQDGDVITLLPPIAGG